jgi:plasmid stability protein
MISFDIMSSLIVRNIPERVHKALRRIAADRGQSVEALVRATLEDVAKNAQSGGIDFKKLERDRAALGLIADGPDWGLELDEPTLSRRVLGLE